MAFGLFEVTGNEDSKSIIKSTNKLSARFHTYEIENREYTIKISKEIPEFSQQSDFNSQNVYKTMDLNYSKNKNPYEIEDYFDEFNYGKPPGFN